MLAARKADPEFLKEYHCFNTGSPNIIFYFSVSPSLDKQRERKERGKSEKREEKGEGKESGIDKGKKER